MIQTAMGSDRILNQLQADLQILVREHAARGRVPTRQYLTEGLAYHINEMDQEIRESIVSIF